MNVDMSLSQVSPPCRPDKSLRGAIIPSLIDDITSYVQSLDINHIEYDFTAVCPASLTTMLHAPSFLFNANASDPAPSSLMTMNNAFENKINNVKSKKVLFESLDLSNGVTLSSSTTIVSRANCLQLVLQYLVFGNYSKTATAFAKNIQLPVVPPRAPLVYSTLDEHVLPLSSSPDACRFKESRLLRKRTRQSYESTNTNNNNENMKDINIIKNVLERCFERQQISKLILAGNISNHCFQKIISYVNRWKRVAVIDSGSNDRDFLWNNLPELTVFHLFKQEYIETLKTYGCDAALKLARMTSSFSKIFLQCWLWNTTDNEKNTYIHTNTNHHLRNKSELSTIEKQNITLIGSNLIALLAYYPNFNNFPQNLSSLLHPSEQSRTSDIVNQSLCHLSGDGLCPSLVTLLQHWALSYACSALSLRSSTKPGSVSSNILRSLPRLDRDIGCDKIDCKCVFGIHENSYRHIDQPHKFHVQYSQQWLHAYLESILSSPANCAMSLIKTTEESGNDSGKGNEIVDDDDKRVVRKSLRLASHASLSRN